LSCERHIDPPAGSKVVASEFDCVSRSYSGQQFLAQPFSAVRPDSECVAKYPRLVPPARMDRAEAIVFKLPNVEDRALCVRQ
jgi:hypothetical protein